MGDNLDPIDLGSGFGDYDSIKCSAGFTCVLSTSGKMKCFGLNDKGQLGVGDTNNRGDEGGEMGDDLGDCDLGSDYTVSSMAKGYGGSHSCAVSDGDVIKSWGSNDYGQLGNGDTSGASIGDSSDEMGDNLSSVNVDGTPTSDPTSDPTADPTKDPTTTPAPTSIPEPQMSMNDKSTCSVWDDEVKCWGDRSVVDPTYEGTTMDPAYWYKPPIDALDLGSSFTPDSVSCGRTHQCALSTDGAVRCWGDNRFALCP